MIVKESQSDKMWDVALTLSQYEDYSKVTTVVKQIFMDMFNKMKISLVEPLPDHPLELNEQEISYMKQLTNEIEQFQKEGRKEELAENLTEYIDRFTHLFAKDEQEAEHLHKVLMKSLLQMIIVNNYRNSLQVRYPALFSDEVSAANFLPLEEHDHTLNSNSEYYSPQEAAEIAGVSDQTIRRWCKQGVYPGAEQGPGKQWKIPKQHFKVSLTQAREAEAFLNDLHKRNREIAGGEIDEFDLET
ncbi:helix-turn-helix domain-containing protein [Peribacillus cavernae]|nr:helix-turn-helix domain-containing protein [Peribacillus cavernae]MDQ0220708.1 excisionase family DNA binding protein [Peribacillus cavernae]